VLDLERQRRIVERYERALGEGSDGEAEEDAADGEEHGDVEPVHDERAVREAGTIIQ
jgi:hypothetical protein